MLKKAATFVGCLVQLSLLILGCASHKAMWGNEKDGFVLSYRMAPGESLTYASTTEEKTSLTIMGSNQESTRNLNSTFTITTDKADQAGLDCRVTIDAFSHKSSGQQGEQSLDAAPILGKTFGMALSPLGEEADLQGIEDLKIDMGPQNGGKQSVLNFYRDILPDLPDKPVKIGDSWTKKGEFSTPAGNMDLTIATETTHTLSGKEIVGGAECLKISATFTGTINGAGEQDGNNLDFDATTTGSLVWYFDYKKGVYVKSEGTSKIEDGAIDVSGSYDISIPLTQETTTSVQLVQK